MLLKQGEEFDIHFRDAQGSYSSRLNGNATVVTLAENAALIAVLVVYPAGATEVYQFRRSPTREVVWTHVKYAAVVDKVSAFQADCE